MLLSNLDYIIAGAFFLLIISVGLSYTRKAGKDMTTFFLAGRNLPWYIAGISMVATTFGADTPLAVTEIVHADGIAGNWLWWCFLAGGMLTTFFFANLWRKAEVLTEVELIELRYSGWQAALLRGFKSIYLGIFLNVIIIAWVNEALQTLLVVFFELSEADAFWITVLAMIFVAIYASFSGLLGVVMTDVIQFVIAMIGCIVLAIFTLRAEAIGGIVGLKEQLTEIDPAILNFLPTLGESNSAMTLGLGIAAFLTYATVQWWASWYPGAEPGGGGYIAQRMMSAKSEKDAVYATLFFQIAHYCIRPWPWILVGLAALVLYPELNADTAKFGYVYAMRDFLPNGFKGLLLITFFAAYMSTISTQLNWGTSYLVNDFFKRFLMGKPGAGNKNNVILFVMPATFAVFLYLAFGIYFDSYYVGWNTFVVKAGLSVLLAAGFYLVLNRGLNSSTSDDKQLVLISRLSTIIVMVVALFASAQLASIKGAWTFLMQCGAGLGLVLILRWYWWRINAWSEIVATLAPFLVMGVVYIIKMPRFSEIVSEQTVSWLNTFPNMFLITVAFTTVSWLIVTYFTKPTKEQTLRHFYDKVQPMGNWKPFVESKNNNRGLTNTLICWIAGIFFTYGVLFLIGKVVLMEWKEALINAVIVVVSFVVLIRTLDKTSIFKA